MSPKLRIATMRVLGSTHAWNGGQNDDNEYCKYANYIYADLGEAVLNYDDVENITGDPILCEKVVSRNKMFQLVNEPNA